MTVSAYVKPVPPEGFPMPTVYFEVTDPDDRSPYEGDKLPNDNLDPDKRMKQSGGVPDDPCGYLSFQTACLSCRNTTAQRTMVNGETNCIAETTLFLTDRYSGDNYKVRATLQNPAGMAFDTASAATPNNPHATSTVASTPSLVAWKRYYVEQANMLRYGATLTANAPAGSDELFVDNTLDFAVGDDVIVFSPTSSHACRIVEKTDHPTVSFVGGGGSNAVARVSCLRDRIHSIWLVNPGEGYTSAPEVVIDGMPLVPATARATLEEQSVARISVTDGGTGYTDAATVMISSPDNVDGIPATAAPVVIDGTVAWIAIQNGGSGYTSPPVVTIVPNGTGTGAVATAELSPTSIKSVELLTHGLGVSPLVNRISSRLGHTFSLRLC